MFTGLNSHPAFRPLRLLAIALVLLALAGCGRSPRWNVLLVTFDTTRADRIGCYGNDSIETPALDGLAAEGVLFEHAYSAVPITAPSHSTILTGRYPMAHGVRDNGMFVLGDEQLTLAEMLKEEGYATAAAIGSFPLSAKFGLDQGFDLYDDHFTLPFEDLRGKRIMTKRALFFDERRAPVVNEALRPWLEAHKDGPFFAWAHYFDPHQPYEPPAPYKQLYAADPYDGEIASADEAFGSLMEQLERLGLADRTVVIFTSDHGDGLGEHNETTHSTLAYNSTLHVPLILRIPGRSEPLVIEQRVGTVDIVPTVLDLLRLPIPPSVQGASLVPLIDARGERVAGFPRPQYAETLSPRLAHDLGELRALYDRQYKYIFGPRPELYDLEADPAERHDLLHQNDEVAAALHARLEKFIGEHASQESASSIDVDPETRRRLEALGYIQSSGEGPTTVEERLDGSGEPPQDRVADVNEVSSAKHYILHQQPVLALGVLETLLRRAPEHPYYLQLKASAELQVGNLDQALVTIEQVRRHRPDGLPSQPLMQQMATQLHFGGRTEKAIELLRDQLVAQPDAVSFWYLASLYKAVGQTDEQRQALEEALSLDPSFAPARVDVAVGHARAGRRDEARTEIERALSDQPYYPKAHYNFAALLLEEGDGERAHQHLARAILLQPDYVQAHYAQIQLLVQLERHAEAQAALAELLARVPEGPVAAQARSLLRSPT